jgi:hypothetical protein
MAAPLIQDVQEMLRWFDEGRTPTWMSAEHERKYGVRVSPEAFINRHRRMGHERTLSIRHERLLPWKIAPEHRGLFAATMLRAYGRRKAGKPLSSRLDAQLDAFLRRLEDGDLVVHYDASSEDGFALVPRRVGLDGGLIREPYVRRPTSEKSATARRSVRTQVGQRV